MPSFFVWSGSYALVVAAGDLAVQFGFGQLMIVLVENEGDAVRLVRRCERECDGSLVPLNRFAEGLELRSYFRQRIAPLDVSNDGPWPILCRFDREY